MTGAVPSELSRLSRLDFLDLHRNRLTSSIPTELGKMNVGQLHLSYNMLTGLVPSELGNMKHLNLLWLERNDLSGTIPNDVCDLKRNLIQEGGWLRLSTDCIEEVHCECCGECCDESLCQTNPLLQDWNDGIA